MVRVSVVDGANKIMVYRELRAPKVIIPDTVIRLTRNAGYIFPYIHLPIILCL